MVLEAESGDVLSSTDIGTIDRTALSLESLGITLAEGKAVLKELQHAFVK